MGRTVLCDRMIVQHRRDGTTEEFVVITVGGKLKVRRVAHQVSIPMPSSTPLDDGTVTFTEEEGESEKRLLAIYKGFTTRTMR